MDIDNDGIEDLVSGQYLTEIFLFKGLGKGKGVQPAKNIEQTIDYSIPENMNEGLFTNATFGDYNGDGLLDMFTGGAKGLVCALNVGTKEKPIFDKRLRLKNVDGTTTNSIERNDAEKEEVKKYSGDPEMVAADFKSFVLFVDWDRDGTGDLISTSLYTNEKSNAISFHKGVKTEDGIRFEKPVPLFTAKDGKRAIPGYKPVPTVCDLNNDGILDLVIGFSSFYNKESKEIDRSLAENFVDVYSIENPAIKTRGYVMVILGK